MIVIEIMAFLSIILIGFQLLNIFINAVTPIHLNNFNQNFNHNYPLISVLIPARNEEKNIENILTDLINQNYKNIEIIVYDDNSEDNTAKIIENLSQKDDRIKLIKSVELPKGWLGKPHACYKLAQYANGEFLLFVDADVRINGSIIERVVDFSISKNIDLLSIFPKQMMFSFGEKITVPIMNFILLSLLPLIFVRKSTFSSHAAANGQFMFFSKKSYIELEPHYYARNHKVEDIAIARFFKKNKKIVSTHLGDDEIRCRMYENYEDAVNGFSKNIAEFFGNSYLIAILFWLLNTFGFIFVWYVFGFDLMLLTIIAIAVNRIIVAHLSKQCISENLKFAILQQFSFLFILINSFKNKINKSYKWKGRNI